MFNFLRSLLARLTAVLAPRLGKLALCSLADQIIFTATNFLTTAIMARTSGQEQLGSYTLAISLVNLVMQGQMYLISGPFMIHNHTLTGISHKIYSGSTLLHQIFICIISAFVFLSAAYIVSVCSNESTIFVHLLFLLGLLGPFMLARDFARRFCFGLLKPDRALAIDLSIAAVQLFALLVLAQMGLLTASVAVCAYGVACAIVVIVWFSRHASAFRFSMRNVVVDLKHNWNLGKWWCGANLLGVLGGTLLPWMLISSHGLSAAGVWAACLGLMALANVPFVGLTNLLDSKIAHMYAHRGIDAMVLLVIQLLALSCILSLAFLMVIKLFGDFILQLLYGQDFYGNGDVAEVLSLQFVAASIGYYLSSALFTMRRSNIEFQATMLMFLVTIGLGYWMSGTFGLLGAAWAMVAGQAAALAVRSFGFYVVTVRLRRSSETLGSG